MSVAFFKKLPASRRELSAIFKTFCPRYSPSEKSVYVFFVQRHEPTCQIAYVFIVSRRRWAFPIKFFNPNYTLTPEKVHRNIRTNFLPIRGDNDERARNHSRPPCFVALGPFLVYGQRVYRHSTPAPFTVGGYLVGVLTVALRVNLRGKPLSAVLTTPLVHLARLVLYRFHLNDGFQVCAIPWESCPLWACPPGLHPCLTAPSTVGRLRP